MEYVTVTELMQLAEEEMFYLHMHILPHHSAPQPYGWFADQQNQELLALVYDTILSVGLDSENDCPNKPSYHIKRSRNLRALINLKLSESRRQHAVFPKQPEVFSGLTPRAAFISEEGKKVLPFWNQQTQGGGYKSLRVCRKSVDAYVDNYPLTDARGIFKILSRLDPQHSLCTDLRSYFQPSSTVLDSVSDLAHIPTTGLSAWQPKRKKETKSKMSLSRKCKIAPSKGSRDGAPREVAQSSIKDMFGRKKESATASHSVPFLDSIDLSQNAIEEFCDFEHPGATPSPLKQLYVPLGTSGNNTPPLSPQAHPSNVGKDIPPIIPLPSSATAGKDTPLLIPQVTLVDCRRRDGSINLDGDCGVGLEKRLSQLFQDDGDDMEIGIEEGRTSNEFVEPSKGDSADMDTFVDLTDSKDVLKISSSDEECDVPDSSCNSQSSQPRGNSSQKRKKLKHPKEIVKNAKSVDELTPKQIRQWMYFRKPLLVDIFKRIIYSRRHEDFVSSHKKRDALKYEVGKQMFTAEQVQLITDLLLHIFCGRHMKYFNYVMSVLLPECMIRITGDVYNITFEQAEQMMFNYQHPAKVS